MKLPSVQSDASPDARVGDLSFVARGGLLNLVGAVANALFGFLLVVVVSRGLPSTQVGLLLESIALFNIAFGIAQWGADVGIVRTIPRLVVLGRSHEVRRNVEIAIGTVFVIGVVLGGLVFAFASQLSRLFTNDVSGQGMAPLVRVLAPFIPISASCAVALATTRGIGTMGPTNAIDKIGRAAAQPLLLLVAVLIGARSSWLAAAWAGPFLLAFAASVLILRRLLRRVTEPGLGDTKAPYTRQALGEFWRFAAPRGLAGVFALTVLWLDTLLIGALRTPDEAGIYAAATRYLLFGSVVSQAILGVVGPKLSELLTGGMRARAKAVYRAATAWGMILSWPFYLTMAVFAPALLSVLGHNFLQARTVLIVLGLSMVVATGVGPVDMVLLMGGKSTWNLLNTLAAVILNITLNLLLIPRLGMEGAAIAWSASILANNLVPLIQTWSFLKLHPFGRPPFVVGAAAVACFGGGGLAAALAFGTALPVLLVSFALSSIVYASILWRFRADIESAVLWEALRSLRPSLRREPST